jgi:hypothetical protein
LEASELDELERWYPVYSALMPAAGKAAAEAAGFFEVDRDGDLVTPVVKGTPGKEECAYTGFEGDGNCFCTIERCFFAGTCGWRKPISCRLYPIRVTKLTGGGKALNLHRWAICHDAFEKGRREGIRVYQFLREPLTDAFGADFYDALCAAADHVINQK